MFEHFAYLDAGTGSLFIQVIFGTGLALMVVLRRSARVAVAKVKTAFTRQSVANEEA